MPARPAARRIVSLVPSLTETLFDLGVGEWVVGVTEYCTSPLEAARRTRVGGPQTLDLEVLFSLAPDLVVASEEENKREDLERIRERVELFRARCRSLAEACRLLRALGARVGGTEAAEACVARIREAEAQLEPWRAPADGWGPGAGATRVFYPLWRDPWITISRGSFAAAMLAAVGAESIFADRETPYPQILLREARARCPEVILLPDEPWRFRDAERAFFADWGARRVVTVPGRWAAWYGTRIDTGLAGLRDAIHGTAEPRG